MGRWGEQRRLSLRGSLCSPPSPPLPLSSGLCLALPSAVSFETWCTVAGFLLLGMALIPTRLGSAPLTTSLIYLGIGLALGPLFLGAVPLSPAKNGALLERLSEIAVLVSLFTAGLNLRLPFSDPKWLIPLRLASISMAVTVALTALVAHYGLGLPVGAAILLGAILAPTDPVLASDVQVEHAEDQDRLRFSLTGEAGLNDGTAFPFVMLGLGLLGLHDIGSFGWKWILIDGLWSIAGGLAIGATLGFMIAKVVVYLRSQQQEAIGTDDFLALGVIAITYGVALFFHTYGFLAVFAAGLALRHSERVKSEQIDDKGPSDAEPERLEIPEDEASVEEFREKLASHPDRAARFMAREMLHFNHSLERIAELGLVVLLGALISRQTWSNHALWLAPLLFLIIRPISTFIGLLGARKMVRARPFVAWFGIRGIGSLYYLFYATQHGLSPDLARTLVAITLSVVALSILVHGISVTPLMNRYNRQK